MSVYFTMWCDRFVTLSLWANTNGVSAADSPIAKMCDLAKRCSSLSIVQTNVLSMDSTKSTPAFYSHRNTPNMKTYSATTLIITVAILLLTDGCWARPRPQQQSYAMDTASINQQEVQGRRGKIKQRLIRPFYAVDSIIRRGVIK